MTNNSTLTSGPTSVFLKQIINWQVIKAFRFSFLLKRIKKSVSVAETLLKVPPELKLLEFNTSLPTLQVIKAKGSEV